MSVRYHDSNLVGIRSLEPRRIQLNFITEDGEPFDIILHSVTYLKCDGYRQGNIVLDVEQPEVNEIAREELEHLFDVDRGKPSESIDRVYKEIAANEVIFFRLTSSYGADILALCEAVEIIEGTAEP